MQFIILLPTDENHLFDELKQIKNLSVTAIQTKRFDGDVLSNPTLITAASGTVAIVVKQIANILQTYFKTKKQIKIVANGTEITCNTVEEVEKIITKLDNKNDE